MYRTSFLILFTLISLKLNAQLVEVVNNITSGGDVLFGATNFSKTPVFIRLEFTELQNTTNDGIRIYYRKLSPGYNNILNLTPASVNSMPYFYYTIKSYRSDPLANVDLGFPYLIPFTPGKKVTIFDVKNIDGFWGDQTLKYWKATGFIASQGEVVYAARTGVIVELTANDRYNDPAYWYNTWMNTITVLQPDGTIIAYKNVIDKKNELKINQKILAGQELGEVAPGSDGIIVLIYHNTINNDDLTFIIPQFVTETGKTEMLNSTMEIHVVHPDEIRSLEMSKKEQRNILK